MFQPILKAPKGTRDLFGAEAEAFQELEQTARRVFKLFHFSEVRTPLFEPVELFSRSLGETSDVVEKEMFTFSDRGERVYALRPEGTAGVVRFFVENDLAKKAGTHRLFYTGPMFRGERPQAGRYRQFWQIGAEFFGSADAVAEADTVLMVSMILKQFGLTNFSVHVNSIGCKTCRAAYRMELLKYLKTKEKDLTEESLRRMNVNPLRVIDSKADGPKLKDAPVMKIFLCLDCRAHYQLFLDLLTGAGAGYEENLRLVRGLDYYSRSVFEWVSPDLGAQSALAAGGRYDDLVEQLGGPRTPAVGFALGMDRVVAARKSPGIWAAARGVMGLVIPLDGAATLPAFIKAQEMREAGVAVPTVMLGKKLKNQLSQAVDIGAKWAILIGEEELRSNQVTIKDLESREQTRVPSSDLIKHINSTVQ